MNTSKKNKNRSLSSHQKNPEEKRGSEPKNIAKWKGLYTRYLNQGKELWSTDSAIEAERNFQYAEHYLRLIAEQTLLNPNLHEKEKEQKRIEDDLYPSETSEAGPAEPAVERSEFKKKKHRNKKVARIQNNSNASNVAASSDLSSQQPESSDFSRASDSPNQLPLTPMAYPVGSSLSESYESGFRDGEAEKERDDFDSEPTVLLENSTGKNSDGRPRNERKKRVKASEKHLEPSNH